MADVTHEGTSLFNGYVRATDGVLTDVISEHTSGAGVTIDGVLLKDGMLTLGTPATLAATGSDQAGAAAISAQVTFVTAADGTKGVRLPGATAGAIYVVYSTVATNGLKVYPASGDDINDGTGDANITIEGKTMAIFIGMDTSTWGAIFTANT